MDKILGCINNNCWHSINNKENENVVVIIKEYFNNYNDLKNNILGQ